MSRTIATADLQGQYRAANLSCEVTPYLSGSEWWKESLHNRPNGPLHLHHIFGRGADCEVWHNWIMVSPTVHAFIHDIDPNLGRLCCLYAKYHKHHRMEWEHACFNTALPLFPEWKPEDSLIQDVPEWIDRHYHDWPEANQKMADTLKAVIHND